jgi:hypothetical protein
MKKLISTMALALILAPAANALADPSTSSGQALASSPTAAAAPASPTAMAPTDAKAAAPKKAKKAKPAKKAEAEESWTCTMHPEIHEKHAGKCPKCGMDLVKEKAPAAAATAAPMAVSGDAKK